MASQVLGHMAFPRLALAASLLAGVGVALGALGAHALSDALTASQLETFAVAVRYQMWHSIAVLAISISGPKPRQFALAGTLLLLGAVLFASSLYALVLLDVKWVVYLTPLGGAIMIAGWIVLALVLLRQIRAGD